MLKRALVCNGPAADTLKFVASWTRPCDLTVFHPDMLPMKPFGVSLGLATDDYNTQVSCAIVLEYILYTRCVYLAASCIRQVAV